MKPAPKTIEALEAELEEVRYQLYEANETIEAIRTGQVDALVVHSDKGHQLYTLKNADQAYRVFIEKMTEGAVTLNGEGAILYSNSQFASMVRLPLSNVIGAAFENFVAAETKAGYHSLFQKCWKEDGKDEVVLQAEGQVIPVQLSMTALELDGVVTLSMIITDLTAQKKTQQQLTESNRQLARINGALELSNHDLQQFASVASHDLQEPLRKIQMFSNLLKDRGEPVLTAELKKYADKIIESSGRMKALIVDILNYSKLSADNNVFEPIDLKEMVNELLNDFELTIQEKSAAIILDDLPRIDANRGQMRQVFQNIISNALKFSRANEAPVISIRARRLTKKLFDSAEQKDGPYCFLSIKDNGIGFDEKYVGQIFTLFERLHTKDAYEGTGIGLAITKKIVDKHNGLVSAKSRPGEGAEFMILLPVTQEKFS